MRASLYSVQGLPAGKISILARPRGGDWLLDEAKAMREAGVDIVVSCLTHEEEMELDLREEAACCAQQGIVYHSFPILDRSVPAFSATTFSFLEQLHIHLSQGKHIASHCRQGLGRSVLTAASLLILSGFPPDQAFDLLSHARGCSVPETKEQRLWVMEFSQRKHNIPSVVTTLSNVMATQDREIQTGMRIKRSPLDEQLTPLLQATITRYISEEARVENVQTSPIAAGFSGAKIQRHQLMLKMPPDQMETSLVTKEAGLLERRMLALLNQQGQRSVPFSHTFDLITDTAALMCLQDLGTKQRSDTTGSFSSSLLMAEAQGLAAIHAANLGQTEALAWLPRADQSYITTYIQQRFWRPAWEQVVHDTAFIELFGKVIPQVEATANTIADEIATLDDKGNTLTLVHSDLNPSNVMIYEHAPYFIDWEIPRYGSLYLDIPHLFHTLERAEYYRQALEKTGVEISPEDFAEGYRIASRFVGLRYLWLPLKAWREDHTRTKWIQHYLSMILQ